MTVDHRVTVALTLLISLHTNTHKKKKNSLLRPNYRESVLGKHRIFTHHYQSNNAITYYAERRKKNKFFMEMFADHDPL